MSHQQDIDSALCTLESAIERLTNRAQDASDWDWIKDARITLKQVRRPEAALAKAGPPLSDARKCLQCKHHIGTRCMMLARWVSVKFVPEWDSPDDGPGVALSVNTPGDFLCASFEKAD